MEAARLKRKEAVEALKAADEELRKEREALEKRLVNIDEERWQLAQALDCLSAGEPQFESEIKVPAVEEDLGMTGRIREILKSNVGTELHPTRVRDLLLQTGYKLEGRKNPMAEIHLTLKRLVQQTKKNRSRVLVRDGDAGALYKFVWDGDAESPVPAKPEKAAKN